MKNIPAIVKQVFNRISNIGVEKDMFYLDKIRIQFMNRSAVFIFLATGYFLVDAIRIDSSALWMNVFLFSLAMPILLFNYLKKSHLSRFYIVTVFPLLLLSVFVGFGKDVGVEYVYYVILLGILVLYENIWVRGGLLLFILGVQTVGTYYTFHFPIWYPEHATLHNKTIVLVFSLIALAAIIIELYNEVMMRISAQDRLNNQLQLKNLELLALIQKNEAKMNLFSILAHDLRQPISSFHALSDKISYLIKKGDKEQMVEIANLYEKSGKEISYIMDNLLKWVISQKAGIQPFYEKIKPMELISNIEKEVHVFSGLNNIEFEIEFEPDTEWRIDLNILKIILSNILHNAVKFSSPGSKIIISDCSNVEYYKVKIQDYGKGMSPEEIKEIKNNKYSTRLGNFKTGHGLGLKSCFSLIKHLKGDIEIESEQGIGTSFMVSIPKAGSFQTEEKILAKAN